MQITLIVAGKLDLPEAEAQAEGRVREAFLALLADRFIERAVPCDLPLPPPPVFAKLTVGFCALLGCLWHVLQLQVTYRTACGPVACKDENRAGVRVT